MPSISMPRKRRTYTIDERLIDALARMAAAKNASANRFLENLLWEKATADGFIPQDAEPLGETRGGDRTSTTDEATA